LKAASRSAAERGRHWALIWLWLAALTRSCQHCRRMAREHFTGLFGCH